MTDIEPDTKGLPSCLTTLVKLLIKFKQTQKSRYFDSSFDPQQLLIGDLRQKKVKDDTWSDILGMVVHNIIYYLT